jgi:hypothetical protein
VIDAVILKPLPFPNSESLVEVCEPYQTHPFIVFDYLAFIVNDYSTTIWLLAAAVSVLLIVSRLNIANLLFARGWFSDWYSCRAIAGPLYRSTPLRGVCLRSSYVGIDGYYAWDGLATSLSITGGESGSDRPRESSERLARMKGLKENRIRSIRNSCPSTAGLFVEYLNPPQKTTPTMIRKHYIEMLFTVPVAGERKPV